MYYVYILFSHHDEKLYTGYSRNLKKRLHKHQCGFVKSTKHRRPLELIYYESYINEVDARGRELFLKGGKGKSELKIQLERTYQKIKYKYM